MRIHFIAIGGAAMHNLALELAAIGHLVTGSDDEIYNPALTRLADAGLCPEKFGWFPEKITEDLEVIILGMHAKKDNPELLKALEMGHKVYSYPEYLALCSIDKNRVVVAGSHGKTTTTAIILHVLKSCMMDFDYLVGSAIEGFERMVGLSDAPTIIIEGDEYLSSPMDPKPKIHHYRPHISIITGIAWDHINVFPTFEIYKKQFALFLEMHEEGAVVFYDESDQELCSIIKECSRHDLRLIPYGPIEVDEHKNIHTEGKSYNFPMVGQHNLKNANAARLVCQELGINTDQYYESLMTFTGAKKRLQLLWKTNDQVAFLDFAHAPSKLKATVDSVKAWFPEKNLIAFFELHTFSSLNKTFLDQYAGTMDQADTAFVFFDDHTLKMKNLPELSTSQVKESFGRADLEVINNLVTMHKVITDYDYQSSVILFMSSGTFGQFDFQKFIKEKF